MNSNSKNLMFPRSALSDISSSCVALQEGKSPLNISVASARRWARLVVVVFVAFVLSNIGSIAEGAILALKFTIPEGEISFKVDTEIEVSPTSGLSPLAIREMNVMLTNDSPDMITVTDVRTSGSDLVWIEMIVTDESEQSARGLWMSFDDDIYDSDSESFSDDLNDYKNFKFGSFISPDNVIDLNSDVDDDPEQYNYSVEPEPSAILMYVSGLGFLGSRRCRQARRFGRRPMRESIFPKNKR